MTKIVDLIEMEARASQANKDAPLTERTRITRGHDRARVLQIRLNASEYDAVSKLAHELRLPTSTVARDLLLAGVRAKSEADDDPAAVLARVQLELQGLASRLG